MSINKFITNLDLARQAEILSGETAVFQGGMQLGIPFSGFPSGVDINTIVSLGVIETQYTAFSGDSGTTIFDIVNPSSPYYSVSAVTISASPYTVLDSGTITETVSATTYPIIMTFTALSGDCCSTPISATFNPPVVQELYDRGLYDGLFNGLGQATIGDVYSDLSFYNDGSVFSGASINMEIINYGVHGVTPTWVTGTTSGTVIEYSGLSQYWSNPIYSSLTSGLTLPITPISSDTQTSNYIWTLTDSTIIDDNLIGLQYTGYNVTYSFENVQDEPTTQSYVIGGVYATLEYFSASTLDYKDSVRWLKVRGNAEVDARLTTNKFTMTNGASASTIGYVLTQTGPNGEAEWVINSSADTNTYVTGGTLTGTDLTLEWNTGGSATPISLSGLSSSSFTGNTSGTCINDLWVSNIHSCSPLNINPNNEGNVYFGSTSGITIDLTNDRIGIGVTSPTESLHINGDYLLNQSNGITYSDLNNAAGAVVYLSGTSNLVRHQISVGTGGAGTGAGGTVGIRAWDDTTYTVYGQPGDMHIYAGISSNGLNLISADGSGGGAEDYIRFYAGKSADMGTSDIHIHGTGSTKGFVGIATENPTNTLHINGSFRLENGTEQNGYVLTSNANGVGTWQSVGSVTTGLTLSTVLSNGNSTGSNNISVDNTQKIFSSYTYSGNDLEHRVGFGEGLGLLRLLTLNNTTGDEAYIDISGNGSISLQADNAIIMNSDTFTVGSLFSGFTGVQYSSDFSPFYTNRSLVDKQYVNNSITAATATTTSNILFEVGTGTLSTQRKGVSNTTGGAYAFNTGFGNTIGAGSDYSSTIGFDNTISSSSVASVALGADNIIDSMNYSFAAGASNTINTATGYAVAMGRQNNISNNYAFTVGHLNNVSGSYGVALGNSNTVSSTTATAIGESNILSGQHSLGIGLSNTVSGNYAYSIGRLNTVSNIYGGTLGYFNRVNWSSHCIGHSNTINHATTNSNYSTALGYLNTVVGPFITVGGNSNNVTGNYHSVFGSNHTTTAGSYSTVLGRQNSTANDYNTIGGYLNSSTVNGATIFGTNNAATTGIYPTALGANNLANGAYSLCAGFQNYTLGNATVAFGNLTQATAAQAAAFNNNTRATGTNSFAINQSTLASGTNSFAGGFNSTGSTTGAFAFAYNSLASGLYSTALGGNLNTASNQEATVIGGNTNSVSGSRSSVLGGRNHIITSQDSAIIGGVGNDIITTSSSSGVFVGDSNTIEINSVRSAIVGGSGNTISDNVQNSAIIGGNNLTLSKSNIVLVPALISNTQVEATTQFRAPSTATFIGATTAFTFNCNVGMTQYVDFNSASGDITLTITNPINGNTYTMVVVQTIGLYNLIMPSGWWLNDSAPFDFTTLANDERAMVTMTYINSEWYFAVKKLTLV